MIKYSKHAQKYLSTQEKDLAQRLRNAINNLPSGDTQKIRGDKSGILFRLRVGKYRVLFTVENDVFFIQKIDSRGDIYKGF